MACLIPIFPKHLFIEELQHLVFKLFLFLCKLLLENNDLLITWDVYYKIESSL